MMAVLSAFFNAIRNSLPVYWSCEDGEIIAQENGLGKLDCFSRINKVETETFQVFAKQTWKVCVAAAENGTQAGLLRQLTS